MIKMIKKIKEHSVLFGLIFTIASALFAVGMTYVAYLDQQAYERMQTFLYDCGMDSLGALVSAALYFGWQQSLLLVIISCIIGILVALLSKRIHPDDQPAPFVMELPNYRMPGAKNVGHLLWDKTKDFLQRAFTVIFVASIVIWCLQSFDFRLNMVDPGDSMLAKIAGVLAPLFKPLGLGDWRVVTALITGFLAKEAVVSTMEVLGVTAALTTLTAIPMLAFCLLYTPCVAAIAAVKRELGGKMAVWMVIFQCLVAWIVAWLAYLVAGMLL